MRRALWTSPLILLLLILVTPTAAQGLDLSKARSHVQKKKWRKGLKVLDEQIKEAVRSRHLGKSEVVDAIRLRALLEAGQDRLPAARFWWHAGLNLNAEGANEVLNLAPEEVVAALRGMEVRPRDPPLRSSLTQVMARPQAGAPSTLYSLANRHLDGHVKYELKLGDPHVEQPLFVESTADPLAIYVALDHMVTLYLTAEYRQHKGKTKYFIVAFGRG